MFKNTFAFLRQEAFPHQRDAQKTFAAFPHQKDQIFKKRFRSRWMSKNLLWRFHTRKMFQNISRRLHTRKALKTFSHQKDFKNGVQWISRSPIRSHDLAEGRNLPRWCDAACLCNQLSQQLLSISKTTSKSPHRTNLAHWNAQILSRSDKTQCRHSKMSTSRSSNLPSFNLNFEGRSVQNSLQRHRTSINTCSAQIWMICVRCKADRHSNSENSHTEPSRIRSGPL